MIFKLIEMMKAKQVFAGKAEKSRSPFSGNGMSRTAMLFKIATLGGGKVDRPAVEQDQGRQSTSAGARL